MYSKNIQRLIDIFSKFPTVGPKTATRFVFYLLRLSKEEIQELIIAIAKLKESVKVCNSCFNSFEISKTGDSETICQICSNPIRDKSLLCVVANEIDLEAIEKTKKYKGLYFVLGGTVSNLKKTDLEKLRIKQLENLIKNRSELKEIILAFNLNTEGETTSLYLERILKPFNKKITRLGRGLPKGGELEYADEETLASALEGRK